MDKLKESENEPFKNRVFCDPYFETTHESIAILAVTSVLYFILILLLEHLTIYYYKHPEVSVPKDN